MIDIVNIRNKAKDGTLKFYVEDRYIYCENTITEEKVIVGTETQIEEKDKIIDEIDDKMEELLYLASKCSTIYKNNIEVVGIYDRLKELLEILERGKK